MTLRANDTIEQARAFLGSRAVGSAHQGFPVIEEAGTLVGVLTRRDLLDPALDGAGALRSLVRRAPVIVYDDSSLREAADHMIRESVGRLVVVTRAQPERPIGMLTRSDLLGAHQGRLDESHRRERTLAIGPRGVRPVT